MKKTKRVSMLVDVRHNPFSMKYERINFNFSTN